MTEIYCRACGANKGHNFDGCKNYSALRKIIKIQDTESDGYIAQIRAKKEINEELVKAQNNLNFTSRILACIINLYEK